MQLGGLCQQRRLSWDAWIIARLNGFPRLIGARSASRSALGWSPKAPREERARLQMTAMTREAMVSQQLETQFSLLKDRLSGDYATVGTTTMQHLVDKERSRFASARIHAFLRSWSNGRCTPRLPTRQENSGRTRTRRPRHSRSRTQPAPAIAQCR